jgi:SAM-dependent methyltransferase
MEKGIYRGKLAYFDQAACPDFWDQQWQRFATDPTVGLELGVPSHVLREMRRWVPRGSRCLEAGCGMGNLVYGLTRAGWPCVGVDFAEKTVQVLQALRRDLEVRLGDVRALPFPDGSFDCYISQGVIEHFPDGYGPILREMDRVLRPGGVALVSFPSENRLRRLKRRFGRYAPADRRRQGAPEFYQFALNPRSVCADLQQLGFAVLAVRHYEGVLGLADEAFSPLNRLLLWLYNKRDSRLCSGSRRLLEPALAGWAGYCTQIVARKV